MCTSCTFQSCVVSILDGVLVGIAIQEGSRAGHWGVHLGVKAGVLLRGRGSDQTAVSTARLGGQLAERCGEEEERR